VVKPVHAIVAKAAMRSSRRPEYFTCKTVLQFDGLTLDQDLFRARRRPVSGAVGGVGHFDLLLDVGSFFWCCSWNDTRIGKAGAQQGRHGKYEQQATDDRNRYRYVSRQVTAAEKMRLDRGLA
jgi:hypothetical protein